MKLRLFFAINFDETIKKNFYLISSKLQSFNEPVKYEPIDKLHLTLLFLGYVEDTLISHINLQTQKILRQFSQTELIFDRIGVFKNLKQPKVIWIGSRENETLKNLSAELKSIVNQLGIITDEKEFSPHITLGRVKGMLSQEFINFLRTFTFEPFLAKINSFELMESKLESSGSKYFVRNKFLL